MGEDQVSINLPQIVVVGSQSAGKSSVLESIVGREFLPRGDGLCTRRPLILQLYHVHAQQHQTKHRKNSSSRIQEDRRIVDANRSEDEGVEFHDASLTSQTSSSNASSDHDNPGEWAEFLHQPGKKFTDFDAVREEIINDTMRIGGNNAGISNTPIRLKLYSPNVLTLTLIDLPGITRNPIGDQPADIEMQVRELCEKYCSNSRALILAVTAANTDLANSDGLSVAKKVDPRGERTIGVITKLDLMDEGTDASAILSNRLIPLKLGYIGMVNRSQKEINTKTSVQDSRKKEKQFFTTHPSYDERRMGTEYLTQELSKLLYHHIRKSLPSLRNEINSRVLKVDSELRDLGVSPLDDINYSAEDVAETHRVPGSENRMSEVMLNIITRYAKKYSSAIEGKFDLDDEDYLRKCVGHSEASISERSFGTDYISGGAKILSLFHSTFHRELASISPLHNLSDAELKRTILSTMGTKKALFVPENSFDLLVARQIGYFTMPSVQCAQRVFQELCKLAKMTEACSLQRFPTLRAKMVEVVVQLLKKQLQPTIKMIQDIISIEKAYINTSHPDFVGGPNAIKNAYSKNNRSRHEAQPSPPLPATDGAHFHVNNSGSVLPEERSSIDLGTDFDEPPVPQPDRNVLSFLFRSGNGQQQPAQQIPMADLTGMDSNSVKTPPEFAERMAPVDRPDDTLYQENSLYENETLNEMDCEIIKELMKSYLEITKKNVEDLIPKTVMFFLVNYIKDNVQNELVREVYNNRNEYSVYLREDPAIAVRRGKLRRAKKYLLRALDVLAQVDEFRFKV